VNFPLRDPLPAQASRSEKTMTTKPLNIELASYAFMGRIHSNGDKRINEFCGVEYRPALTVVQ
jgi:hypothetical protein